MGRRVACAWWHAGCGGALLGVVLACRLRLGCGSCQDGAPLARARGSRFAWKCVHGQDTCGKASDCAWVARNRLVSGVCGCLPAHVSRETFVPISHYIATIVSRETIPTSAKTANERRAPTERRRLRRTQLRSERGLFSRSIFQTATTARPCGKAVAAFPLVVKATVEAGQVGWKACAAKRSVLVELR